MPPGPGDASWARRLRPPSGQSAGGLAATSASGPHAAPRAPRAPRLGQQPACWRAAASAGGCCAPAPTCGPKPNYPVAGGATTGVAGAAEATPSAPEPAASAAAGDAAAQSCQQLLQRNGHRLVAVGGRRELLRELLDDGR
eukprot:444594-Lingulodinium_polyedra.AAC.1